MELQGAIRNLEVSERRAKGDQRRGAVRQRGISIHQRRAADIEGGVAVAQRRADRPQQPASGNAGAAAHDLQRSAERAVQHRRRDDLSGCQPQYPLLHAGHQIVVQRSSRAMSAGRSRTCSSLAARQRPSERCASRAADAACRSSGRSKRGSGAWYIRRILPYRTQEDAVEGVVITFAEITERKRAANELELAKRQAEAGQCREVAFSRCCQSRSSPAAANACAAPGAAGANRPGRAARSISSRGSTRPWARSKAC